MATGDGDNLNWDFDFKLRTGQPTPPNVYYVPLFKNSGLGNLGLLTIHWFSLIRLIKLLNPYFWGGVRYGGVGWLAIFSSVWTSELLHEKNKMEMWNLPGYFTAKKMPLPSKKNIHQLLPSDTVITKWRSPTTLEKVTNNPQKGHSEKPEHTTETQTQWFFVGFFRGEYSRGGGNWGTLRIPREDWGTLGKIRGITTPP